MEAGAPALWQGGWNLLIFGVLSNPSHPVILYVFLNIPQVSWQKEKGSFGVGEARREVWFVNSGRLDVLRYWFSINVLSIQLLIRNDDHKRYTATKEPALGFWDSTQCLWMCCYLLAAVMIMSVKGCQSSICRGNKVERAFPSKEAALDLIHILYHSFPCADVTLFFKSQQPSLDQ